MALIELSASEMLSRLESGELSSVELVEALHRRADEVEPHVNALTHRFRESSLAAAKAADDARRQKGAKLGPLHGLPITVKESIETEGVASTMGAVSRRNEIATRDALTVELAKRAGAIVIGKTNVPQLLWVPMESSNELYGTTHNPFRIGHGPGGSSGGEGAAIASGSSPLGIGTDIGGSIRVPAAFCGVVGLKPTVHRWSNLRSHTAVKGQELIRGQIGPMARTATDVDLFMRALSPVEMNATDHYVPPIPYVPMAKVKVEKLRVGFYEHDGFFAPAASVRRGVREAVKALEARGVEVVPYEPAHAEEITYLYFKILGADGQAAARRLVGEDRVVEALSTLWRAAMMPPPLRKALGVALETVGEVRLGRLLRGAGERTVDQLFGLAARRAELRHEEVDRWQKAGIDALVTPAYATTAAPIGMAHDFTLGFCYVARWNVLDFPAGVVPVTTVRENELVRSVHGRRDRLERRAEAIEAKSEGLPVGVQVVARPYQENVALAVMSAIEIAARAAEGFPITPVSPRLAGR